MPSLPILDDAVWIGLLAPASLLMGDTRSHHQLNCAYLRGRLGRPSPVNATEYGAAKTGRNLPRADLNKEQETHTK